MPDALDARQPGGPPHDPLRDADMPSGMAAQPGEGDLEEAFTDVMPDVDSAAVMPPPVADGAFLDAIEADAAAMSRELDRLAADDQARADADAAAGIDRAGADAASFIDDFDVGIEPTDTYSDPY